MTYGSNRRRNKFRRMSKGSKTPKKGEMNDKSNHRCPRAVDDHVAQRTAKRERERCAKIMKQKPSLLISYNINTPSGHPKDNSTLCLINANMADHLEI